MIRRSLRHDKIFAQLHQPPHHWIPITPGLLSFIGKDPDRDFGRWMKQERYPVRKGVIAKNVPS